MSSHRRSMREAAVMAAFVVSLPVPSLAQRTGDVTSSAPGSRTVATALPSANSAAGGSDVHVIPLDITDELRPLVERMWRTSPTFRRQCARLAAESVRVVVRVDIALCPTANAETKVDVRSGIVRSVHTRLRVIQPEYLAHELEHVLEQLDGVDLRWAVLNRLAGAWRTSSDTFETVRAIATGRLVAQEAAGER